MHLEATGASWGEVGDLGGQVDYGKPFCGILSPSLATLWVMLKLSRAMAGHVEAISELCWAHLGVKCKDRSNILGPDWGQVWPSGSYTSVSWGKVGGS